MVYSCHFQTPLGTITLASDGTELIGLWFERQKHCMEGMPVSVARDDLPVFDQTRLWLGTYFSGSVPDFTPPINPNGTDFQKDIWALTQSIPYGMLTTYSELARLYTEHIRGRKTSPRAVAAALSKNPILLIVPCHRVIAANGALSGYAAGTGRKFFLLEMERDVSSEPLRAEPSPPEALRN